MLNQLLNEIYISPVPKQTWSFFYIRNVKDRHLPNYFYTELIQACNNNPIQGCYFKKNKITSQESFEQFLQLNLEAVESEFLFHCLYFFWKNYLSSQVSFDSIKDLPFKDQLSLMEMESYLSDRNVYDLLMFRIVLEAGVK